MGRPMDSTELKTTFELIGDPFYGDLTRKNLLQHSLSAGGFLKTIYKSPDAFVLFASLFHLQLWWNRDVHCQYAH